ncbi:MAG: hypothetical protein RLZZ117_1379 [Cyanobacteriota bacterium]
MLPAPCAPRAVRPARHAPRLDQSRAIGWPGNPFTGASGAAKTLGAEG